MPIPNKVSNVERRERPYKLFDRLGLYLIVRPSGRHWWRFRYRFDGMEKTLSLGVFPDVGLSDARQLRDEARKLVAKAIDPSDLRKEEKAAREIAKVGTFRAVAEEWLDTGCPGSQRTKNGPTEETIRQLRGRLEKYVFQRIGHKPMVDLKIADLRGVLTPISKRGKLETAHRVRSLCERIWRYAIATERAERNIAADLQGTLAPAGYTGGFAAITNEKSFGGLLAAIDEYEGYPATMYALKLAPLVFVRPIELRVAEWSEIDLAKSVWSIPENRMKERRPHIVPLSKQAKTILKDLNRVTGNGSYLFPSVRTNRRPMSDNTMNAALRRLGYTTEQMTTHGFRKSASTLLHELGYRPEWIEAQLAHKLPGVAGVYNKAVHLRERKKMMQEWADYLDGLKK
jgi:integrase